MQLREPCALRHIWKKWQLLTFDNKRATTSCGSARPRASPISANAPGQFSAQSSNPSSVSLFDDFPLCLHQDGNKAIGATTKDLNDLSP
jgi:hypothetical protein